MNFAVSLMNLTLLSLRTSNLLASPFVSRRNCVSASRITISRSFAPAFFNFEQLSLSHSLFSKFLETTIVLKSSSISHQIVYRRINQASTGGGVFTFKNPEQISITSCCFQTCCSNTADGGGVLYAEVASGYECKLETVSVYYCTARVGAFAVVKQQIGATGSTFNVDGLRLFDCSPSIRQACNDTIYVDLDNVTISRFNVTDSHVMNRGSSLALHRGESISIKDSAVFRNHGNSILDLVCPIASDISLERIYIINSSARSYGLIFVSGNIEIKYGIFFGNTGKIVHSQSGKVHFTQCWFDHKVEDGIFEEYELCPIADDPRHFLISFTQTQVWKEMYGYDQASMWQFVDQTESVPPERTEPPAKTNGFAMNTTGSLTVSDICLVIVVMVVTGYFVIFLNKYRQHVVHRVHVHCAEEYRKNNLVEDELLPVDCFEDDDEQQIIDYNIPIGNIWDTDDEGVIQANEALLDDNDEASEAMRRRKEEEMWEKREQEARKTDYKLTDTKSPKHKSRDGTANSITHDHHERHQKHHRDEASKSANHTSHESRDGTPKSTTHDSHERHKKEPRDDTTKSTTHNSHERHRKEPRDDATKSTKHSSHDRTKHESQDGTPKPTTHDSHERHKKSSNHASHQPRDGTPKSTTHDHHDRHKKEHRDDATKHRSHK